MLKKYTVLSLSAALLLTAAFVYSLRQAAAGTTEMLDTAAMLPDSDVVVTMDFDRTLNVAATNLLSQDATKIEHLKNLMKTVENQIGINPYEIRQIAAGFKLPPDNSKNILTDAEFTAIIRTNNSNANLLDEWSRKVDLIAAFKEEQAPSLELMNQFRTFRDFKFEKATLEKVAEMKLKYQGYLKQSQDIAAKLNALPKLAADAASVSNLKDKNQTVADDLKETLNVLQADTEMKTLRATSIKLLNRWNAVTLDDAQRTVKLAALTKESKEIFPAYEKKYQNAKKLESLVSAMDTAVADAQTMTSEPQETAVSRLDATLASLAKLPATKAAKTAELNRLADDLDSFHGSLRGNLDSTNFMSGLVEPKDEPVAVVKPKSTSFYDSLKKAERRETVNGKPMLIIDLAKFEDAPADGKTVIKDEPKRDAMPNLAIGFLDEKTMVVGFERTVTPFLKRDPAYKNQKVLEMLGAAQNSLFAFVVNSRATSQMFAQMAKSGATPDAAKVSESSFFDNLTKDISIYGSVNFDGDKTTNDVSMSLGFFKEIVGNLPLPETGKADPDADSTFEFAGYQVGKDIFYDLFNSFKAVQASMTFKFEKKKVAALVRSAPKIIESVRAKNSGAKKELARTAPSKPNKLESVADLLTAPQFYMDLAGLLKKDGKK